LHLPQLEINSLDGLLNDDEKARAVRLAPGSHRNHFIAARGILRSILGLYLERPASSIEFTYDQTGKPRLIQRGTSPSMRFNVSHSQGLAVYAFACHRELGVDVEAIRTDLTTNELAERYFSSKEVAEIRSFPSSYRNEAFFVCWTRKEAYLKARGDGLAVPLDSFDVSLAPTDSAELRSDDSLRWTLRSFRPAQTHVAAVVAEGKDWNLELVDWPSADSNRS
jgi:4'-phosphopantetheinyl transferase